MAKIRVKLGAAEAEVEADPEHLKEAMELVPELAAKLPSQWTDGGEPKAQAGSSAEPASIASSSEVPSVSIEKGDSLAEVIGKFFAAPWGREKRKLSDVRDALQTYGLNYPKQSVAVALLRLAKTTRLRRFKAEDGEFVYTSGTTLPSVRQPQEGPSLDAVAPAEQN